MNGIKFFPMLALLTHTNHHHNVDTKVKCTIQSRKIRLTTMKTIPTNVQFFELFMKLSDHFVLYWCLPVKTRDVGESINKQWKNCGILLMPFFYKKFREINLVIKSLHTNIFKEKEIFVFFTMSSFFVKSNLEQYTVLVTKKKIRQIKATYETLPKILPCKKHSFRENY